MSDKNEKIKKALIAIKKLKSEIEVLKNREFQREPIAIIGMSCHFPGSVNSPEEYWKLLSEGRDAISEIPKDRWGAINNFYDKTTGVPGKSYIKEGGFLNNAFGFDNSFFEISPIDAMSMDPQHRVLLETTYEAIEDAGQDLNNLKRSETGVFVATWEGGYAHKQFNQGNLGNLNAYAAIGSGGYAAAGRISYTFGLEGPCLALDTACSSSLVSIHLACQSLHMQECDMALTGGVNLILSPALHIALSQMNALSPDARCKAFDADANGFVRSEGSAMLVLKRLSDAERAGDDIKALIRGSAINEDGRSNGFTAPNAKAQEKLIRKALKSAGLSPDEISYIEAHGTGTAVGDPIEVSAIEQTLIKEAKRDTSLILGAVKTNIGHAETAAGIAGVLKLVLATQHKKIPGNLHFNTPTTYIDWESTPIKIPTAIESWEGINGKRIGGVSSFGMSGINAHVIIEEAPEIEKVALSNPENTNFILPISAKSPEALKAHIERYIKYLENTDENLYDICATAALRRTHFEHRLGVTGTSKEDIIEELKASLEDTFDLGEKFDKGQNKVVFVYSGQGSQWIGMGKELYKNNAAFRKTFDYCNKAFSKYIDWSLIEEIHSDEKNSKIHIADRLQPSICAIQIALTSTWRFFGINPQAVVGHSMGEIAASYVAGMITIDEAAKIICSRSKLMKNKRGQGGMLLIGLKEEEVNGLILPYGQKLSIAVQNDPNSVVIGGELSAIEEIFNQLTRQKIFCKKVKMDVAAHTNQMDSIKQELFDIIKDVRPKKSSSIAFYSSVKGKKVHKDLVDQNYWVANVREKVQFSKVMKNVFEDGYNTFVEISAHPILTTSIRTNSNLMKIDSDIIYSFSKDSNDQKEFSKNLSTLYSLGQKIIWDNLYTHSFSHSLLPSYPWQRRYFKIPEVEVFVKNGKESDIGNHSEEGLVGSHNKVKKDKDIPFEIKNLIAKTIGVPVSKIKNNLDFNSLGVNSLLATELIKMINNEIGINITATSFWEHPTIKEFVDFIKEENSKMKILEPTVITIKETEEPNQFEKENMNNLTLEELSKLLSNEMNSL